MAAVTDLHANMTAQRLAAVDVLVGYRTNPHVDTYEAGVDAAHQLMEVINRGVSPASAFASVPLIAAPVAQATAQLPLLRVIARAHELERRHRLAAVSVHAGYAYADVPHAGLSITAMSFDGVEGPRGTVEELAALAWSRRDEFRVQLAAPEAALAEAAELAVNADRPVVVADTGDNINGGAGGDGTWLLAEALRQQIPTAITICDPEAVAAARRSGDGSRLTLPLGGRSHPTAGDAVTVDAIVTWAGRLRFTNTGPMARGLRVDMGPAATVRAGPVTILLQSRPVQPNDPQMLHAAGIELHKQRVIVLKGAAAVRAGWAPLVAGFVDAATPGVTDCLLERLPYQHLRDAVWPFKELTADAITVTVPVR
jgi:microcystin degradation protein MlrC